VAAQAEPAAALLGGEVRLGSGQPAESVRLAALGQGGLGTGAALERLNTQSAGTALFASSHPAGLTEYLSATADVFIPASQSANTRTRGPIE
jgi:hypothetical protein